MMKHVKAVFKKYAKTKGRSSRAEFWNFYLFLTLVTLTFIVAFVILAIVWAIGSALMLFNGGFLGSLLLMLLIFFIPAILFLAYIVGIIVPTFCVSVRRLHDVGKSGWMMLLLLIPVVGFIILLILFMGKSHLANQYGESPLDCVNSQVYEEAKSNVSYNTNNPPTVVNQNILSPELAVRKHSNDVYGEQGCAECLQVEQVHSNAVGGAQDESTNSVMKKEKFYKKKWLLATVVGVASCLVGAIVGVVISDAGGLGLVEKQEPVPVELTTGTWTCGEDIAPGRYTATPVNANENGDIYIDSNIIVNESLGDASYAVPSVTFKIKEGDTIEISGMSVVHFEPVNSKVSVGSDDADEQNQEAAESETQTPDPVDLTTGTWICGVDIAPGKYIATPVGGTGTIKIEGSTYVAEILSTVGQGVPSVTFTIEEGDTIEISGLQAVHFEPVQEGVSATDVEDVNTENQTAVPVELSTGTWICGVDIAPGRYMVTAAGIDMMGGTLTISGSNNTFTYLGDIYGVPSVTVTIEEGDVIEINGLSAVHFELVE